MCFSGCVWVFCLLNSRIEYRGQKDSHRRRQNVACDVVPVKYDHLQHLRDGQRYAGGGPAWSLRRSSQTKMEKVRRWADPAVREYSERIAYLGQCALTVLL